MKRTLALLVTALAACGSCPPQSPGTPAPVVPVTGADTDDTRSVVEAAERFANNTCKCSTSTCADDEANEFVEWLRAHPQRSGSAVSAKRVLVAMEKMLFCRDALAYPVEPLDLDSPVAGAPASAGDDGG